MTNTEARKILNSAIANETNADKVAKLEVVREYLTNPDFRKKLEDYVWNINQAKTR